MALFLQPPLNLFEGDLIVAIVNAYNGVGSSIYSDPNTSGELVQVPPK